jgi:hypothetical protein
MLENLKPFELVLAIAYLECPCKLKKLWGIFRKFHFDSLDFAEALLIMEDEGFGKEDAEELKVSERGREEGYSILNKYDILHHQINELPPHFGPEDDYFGEYY